MTIGQLADGAGVNVETIRYYERRGLLRTPERTAAGYRQYRDTDAERLRFIKQAQEYGFTLNEIAVLLAATDDEPAPFDLVRARAVAKLAAVDDEMSRLAAQRARLEALVQACSAGDDGCLGLRDEGPREVEIRQ